MLFRKLNWNVVGWFRIVSAISYAIIIAGLLMMGYTYATKGYALKLGLSFTGGTDVTVKFNQPTTPDAVRSALGTLGVNDASVNTLSKGGDAANTRYTITTQHDFGNNAPQLWTALGKVAPIDRAQSQISTVGPSLSREYLIKALEALVIAIAIQFLYIAFRFGWNYIFGLVTVIALVRDSLMMIGIYAIAGKRADDAFLAAVLTVIGYSVMDTIVILDRIRENTRLMDGEPYDRIVNTSILQTMTRSFNTLATVVITLVALYAFGGASLQNFAFALLVGICSGGYHSIFYSAPLVVQLRERQLKAAAKRRAAGLEPTVADRAVAARPRSVAEARAQNGDRDAIVAARRARREKERAATRNGQPVRYKKKRPEPGTAAAASAVGVADLYDHNEVVEEFEIDPLDAQQAGLHDADLALGHEEIHLNLEDEHDHRHDGDVFEHEHDNEPGTPPGGAHTEPPAH